MYLFLSLILFFWGVSNFGFLIWGLGFLFVCLLGGVAASCQIFKALKLVPIVIAGCLEVISLWIPAIVGKKLWGGWFVPG